MGCLATWFMSQKFRYSNDQNIILALPLLKCLWTQKSLHFFRSAGQTHKHCVQNFEFVPYNTVGSSWLCTSIFQQYNTNDCTHECENHIYVVKEIIDSPMKILSLKWANNDIHEKPHELRVKASCFIMQVEILDTNTGKKRDLTDADRLKNFVYVRLW